jgi:hypothetical protein
VPGVWTLTDLIEREGDVRTNDDAVRRIVGYVETELIALGASDLWAPHLLHAEVHVGDRVIRILPVFTSTQRVVEAIEMSAAWGAFSLLLLSGTEVLADLQPEDWALAVAKEAERYAAEVADGAAGGLDLCGCAGHRGQRPPDKCPLTGWSSSSGDRKDAV